MYLSIIFFFISVLQGYSILFPQLSTIKSNNYPYRIQFYDQTLDHFSFDSNSTFKMRYLINDEYWRKPNDNSPNTPGPIFFYTGNEADITTFADNTGWLWEYAPRFEALIILAEHRYYGESMPFGQESLKIENLHYLTSAQALADFAELIQYLKKIYNSEASKVIAIGGSYGGMLAAWMRVKYPHIIDGSFAASAPVCHFEGEVDPHEYNQIISRVFHETNPLCAQNIHDSWNLMLNYIHNISSILHLQRIFHLCEPLSTKSSIKNSLWSFISSAMSSMAMANYPYPNEFLGSLPANPIQYSCSYFRPDLQTADDILTSVYQMINVYYNYTGQAGHCFNLSHSYSNLGMSAWDYQYCTEMILPEASDGINDIFFIQNWNLSQVIRNCYINYKVTSRPYWAINYYGGHNHGIDWKSVSNIIFSNGNLDPWGAGGIHKTISLENRLIALWIEGGAHHLDLRHSNPKDPPSVKYVREQEAHYIEEFIHSKLSPATQGFSTQQMIIIVSCGVVVSCLVGFFIGILCFFLLILIGYFIFKRCYQTIQYQSLASQL